MDDLKELNNNDNNERLSIRRNSVRMKNKNNSQKDINITNITTNTTTNINTNTNTNTNITTNTNTNIPNNKANDQNEKILNTIKNDRNPSKNSISHPIFLNDFAFLTNATETVRVQDSFVKKMRSKTSNDNRDK
jgi:hypothetical protein